MANGFISKNSCCTVTSVDTSKVLDVEVLSKYCSGYAKIKDKVEKITAHGPNCLKHYDRIVSGGWRKQLQFVYQRSLLNRTVHYVKFLGDGDSKSYSAVVESKPYGDTQVEKLEFIGHIQTY